MHIKFLGTGGYDDIYCGNSAAIISHPVGNILIDCGPSVYGQLKKHNLIDQIDYVLLTHLHGDHMGSLFSLEVKMGHSYDKKMKILCPDDVFKEKLAMLFSLWHAYPEEKIDLLSLSSISGIVSIDTLDKHAKGIQTYAYGFEDKRHIIYYSGDLGDVRVTKDFLDTCDENKEIVVYNEVSRNENGRHHCYYKDLEKVTVGYETYVYHCDHLKKPTDCTLNCVAEVPDLLF